MKKESESMDMTAKAKSEVLFTRQDSVFKLFLSKGFSETLTICCSFFAFTID